MSSEYSAIKENVKNVLSDTNEEVLFLVHHFVHYFIQNTSSWHVFFIIQEFVIACEQDCIFENN